MHNYRIILFLLISAFCTDIGFTNPGISESNALRELIPIIEIYPRFHNETELTDWSQLKGFFNLDFINRGLLGSQSYPIEDHYQFVTQPLPLLGLAGSQVLLIRTVPLEDPPNPTSGKRGQWRYVLCRTPKNHILFERIPEQYIQTMLQRSNIVITPKSSLPAFEREGAISVNKTKAIPNPADVEFLALHPDLDPTRTKPPVSSPTETANPPDVSSNRSQTTHPFTTRQPTSPRGTSSFIVLGGIAVAVISLTSSVLVVICRARKR